MMAGVGGGASGGSSVNNEPTSNTASGGGGFKGGLGARARVKRNFSFRYKHG